MYTHTHIHTHAYTIMNAGDALPAGADGPAGGGQEGQPAGTTINKIHTVLCVYIYTYNIYCIYMCVYACVYDSYLPAIYVRAQEGQPAGTWHF